MVGISLQGGVQKISQRDPGLLQLKLDRRAGFESCARLRLSLELLDPLHYLWFGQHPFFGKQLDQGVQRENVGVAELLERGR